MKKLYKSEDNKVFSGVIGGLGEYYEIDPVLLRLAYLLLTTLTGVFPGIVVYIIASIIVPKKPHFKEARYHTQEKPEAKTENTNETN